MNTACEKRKVRAYIDNKNVSTDWIDMIFDGSNCICGGHEDKSYVGFVNRCVVLARIQNNQLWWNIMPEQYNDDEVQETYDILMERLRGCDSDDQDVYCEYYERLKHDGCVVQEFYFKEEE